MNVKRILQKTRELKSLDESIQRLESAVQRMTPTYGEKTAVSIEASRENRIIELAELREKYAEIDRAVKIDIAIIRKKAQELKPGERTLIELRYENGLPWRRIANIMGYSIDNCFKVHKQALNKLEKG